MPHKGPGIHQRGLEIARQAERRSLRSRPADRLMIMADYLPQAKLGPDVMRFSDADLHHRRLC
jgi:hypothetical protein